MADMIIKPSSGNNLVVQGGDSSPAITVANTGTTTFAENATMSGTLGVTGNTTLSGTANNLGTITSATTFPAGHVIQSKTKEIQLTDGESNYCTTNATAGSVINTASTNLEVTGFSSGSGNLVKGDWSAGAVNGTGAGNGIFGVKIGSTIYSCNFLIASKAQTMTCNFAMVFGSGLSNVTVAAWIAAPNTVTRTMYHHDYNSWYTGVWSMTVQEIQQ